jgi:GT2 family glycosyltransferase
MISMCDSPRVLFIPVHYGSSSRTLRLLQSLKRIKWQDKLNIIVVDNGSTKEARESLRDEISNIGNARLAESNTNRGYFGGAKWALEQHQKSGRRFPDWLVVCNHDVIVRDELILEKLLARNPDKIGVLAPRILSTVTGLDQNPYLKRRPGRLRIAELRLWLASYQFAQVHEYLAHCRLSLRSWMASKKAPEVNALIASETVYAPHGSFIIFSKSYFERGGYIDDGCFLYSEEISVAEICRQVGLPVVYDPELTVFHDEHTATGRDYSRTKYQHAKAALEYLTSRYLTDVE